MFLTAILDLFHQGGLIMWPIFGVSVVVWYLGLYKLYQLWCLDRARRSFVTRFQENGYKQKPYATGDSHYDRLQGKLCSHEKITPGIFRALFREFLLSVVPSTNYGLQTMAAWISVAPLLGLLGTVVGMIRTFDVITLFGVGNPALTAEGISVALLTTEAGLIAAFPGLLLYNFINNRKIRFQKQLFLDGEVLVKKVTD